MDLKSFYKKIDVDNIKSRLPPLPQIKIPKIKSRKIFKSSREDISQQQPPGGMMAGATPLTPQLLPPPSAFIDRTPTRISTVSSLMNMADGLRDKHENEWSTYRTASTFEAEHCPDDGVDKVSGSAASRFGDKCKKTYKDLTEFKIKNLFAKKTVVKKTEIEVDIYARQYERELQEQLELEQRQNDDRDYEFEFKEARRRMSKSSGSESPPGSDQSGVPTPLRSQMEYLQRGATPPPVGRRRNAIHDGAQTKLRLHRSMSEESSNEPPMKPNRSSLWGINEQESMDDVPESQVISHRAGISKLGGFRKSRKEKAPSEASAHSDSVWSLKSIRTRFTTEASVNERMSRKDLQAQDSLEDQSEPEKKGAVPRRKPLERKESLDKNSDTHASSPEGKFSNIKQSIKRLKQRKRSETEESETEQGNQSTKSNMSEQLRAGLRRLKMKERSISFDEEESKPPQATATTRLRDWKKSLKIKRPTEPVPDEEVKSPPARSLTLMRKLNYIRSRKSDSDEGEQQTEAAANDEQRKPKLNNLEKLEQARDKALRKVNAQVQRMKKFQGKSRDSPTESSPEKQERRIQSPEKRPGRLNKFGSDEQSEGEVAEYSRTTAAVWTTSKIMSQSLESESDIEMPRVLIHQDNTDQYESTLIIAVTRPAPPAPTAIIKEIPPRTKQKSDWIPNKNAISSFLEMTPSPPPIKHLDISRGHFRKRSMDSNDSDSWIPDNYRNKSCTSSTSAGLNKITENSEPWKVHSVFSEEKLYKTRSIDIFSKHENTAFEDFDDEMKNVPIKRIAATSADSIDKSCTESTDEDDDYDNASRITRVKRPSPLTSTTAAIETQHSMDSNKPCRGSPFTTRKGQIGNSRESLDASFDDVSTDDDDDAPPSVAPSPPPSFSPPPPPLPLRKPPKMIPERNESMVRLAKPLVKQASLRRHFSEDIEPNDLGKVNKLISRFEKNPSEEHLPTIVADDEPTIATQVEEKKTVKPKEDGNRSGSKKRPAPIPKQPEIQKADTLNNYTNNNTKTNDSGMKEDKSSLQLPVSPETPRRKNLDNASIQSPRSEYGSPMGSMYFSESVSISSEYGSPTATPFPPKNMDQLHSCRRLSNRSSLRDDDTFYSFESDEENNFYSFGESSSSARHTIEI